VGIVRRRGDWPMHCGSGFLWLKRAGLASGLLALFFFVSFLLLVFATFLLLFEIGRFVQGTLCEGGM
jgi:hypothetical protein